MRRVLKRASPRAPAPTVEHGRSSRNSEKAFRVHFALSNSLIFSLPSSYGQENVQYWSSLPQSRNSGLLEIPTSATVSTRFCCSSHCVYLAMSSSSDFPLAVRPDFGSNGLVALAKTNCYGMTLSCPLQFVQYDGKQQPVHFNSCFIHDVMSSLVGEC